MEFSKLSQIYDKLSKTTKRLEISSIISDFIKEIPSNEAKHIIPFLMGKTLPEYDEREMGISSKLIEKALIKSSGVDEKELQKKINEIGDLGKVVEYFMKKKTQRTLGKKETTTSDFLSSIEKTASMVGKGTNKNKIDLISGLLSNSSPRDAKYMVKLIIGELRLGAGEGSLRDAIAKCYGFDAKEVERAWNLMPDYGEIVHLLKTKGKKGLGSVKIKLGIPLIFQLAEKAESLNEIITKLQKPAIEIKYDGLRTQIQKDGDKIWVFTRRLENVTNQFPELVSLFRNCIKAEKAIIDSETLAVDSKGKPLPFQKLSQRIQRKYNIEEMVKTVPIQTAVFDIVYLDGEVLFDKKLEERWEILKGVIKEEKGVSLAKQIRTKNIKKAQTFYEKSLSMGQEGVMVKNLHSKYQPGRRVGYWFKIKPTMESLDLVITGATYGTGKRAGTLSSFILSCRDRDRYVEVGMMGTGIKEKKAEESDVTYEDMTNMILPYKTSESKNEVKIKPKVVIEVGYQEIQRSPTYNSGFALRFPRFLKLRQDKDPRDVDDVERIKRLYRMQGGGNKK